MNEQTLNEIEYRAFRAPLNPTEYAKVAMRDVTALLDEIRRLHGVIDSVLYKAKQERMMVKSAREEGAEAMRAAIQKALTPLWDKGAANVAANVPMPPSL